MSKIWNWIIGEVRTAESIIGKFTATIRELEQHALEHLNIIDDLKEEARQVDAEYVQIKHEIESDYQSTVTAINDDIAKAEAEAIKAKNYAASITALFPTI